MRTLSDLPALAQETTLSQMSTVQLWIVRRVNKAFKACAVAVLRRTPGPCLLGGTNKDEILNCDFQYDSDDSLNTQEWKEEMEYKEPSGLSSVELLSWDTMRWKCEEDMPQPREQFGACRLSDGGILIAGGGGHVDHACYQAVRASMYLFRPSGGWTELSAVNLWQTDDEDEPEHVGKFCFHLCAIGSGRVLAVGGYRDFGAEGSAETGLTEMYDITTGLWTRYPDMAFQRIHFAAAVLPDGRVVAAGGNHRNSTQTAEIFDPETGSWSMIANMTRGRYWFAACVAPNGHFVVSGGRSCVEAHPLSYPLCHCEAWNPETGAWYDLPPLPRPRCGHAMASAGGHLVVTGVDAYDQKKDRVSMLYDFTSARWILMPHLPLFGRVQHCMLDH